MTLWDQMEKAPVQEPRRWIAQWCPPLDRFEEYTLSIGEWIERGGVVSEDLGRVARWELFALACAQVMPAVLEQDGRLVRGLRCEPRVGYDPHGDQPVFIFKADANGTTFVVSPQGLSGDGFEEVKLESFRRRAI